MLACLIGLLAASARAEQAPAPELMLFDEPIVAASKHEQAREEAPAGVTVVTREQIRRLGFRTLAEALRSVPDFYVTDDRNYTSIGTRGFQRPGDYNDRVLLLVNGHAYNDDIYQQAFVDSTFGIPMEAIERIEVIHGPGSALYGGNAMFAVINVVTTSGAEAPGARVVAETGSFGRKRGAFSLGHVFADGLDAFVTGSVLRVIGRRDLYVREFDAPETHHGVAHEADGERALDLFTSARYGAFTLQGGAATRLKHIPTGSFGSIYGDSANKTIDSRYFGEVGYRSEVLPQSELAARAYYDGYDYHGTYAIDVDGERVKNQDLASSHWVGGEVRLRRQLAPGNALTIGGEYAYHPHANQRNFDPGDGPGVDVTRRFGTWGVYGQDEWQLLESFSVVAGLRYDRAYGGLDQVSPRAAAVWSPVRTLHVKLLYGHAFRAPNLYERYYTDVASGVTANVANPGLDPETIDSYEIEVEQALGGAAQLRLWTYHNDIGDLVEQVTVPEGEPNGGAIQYRNVADARANGFGIELRSRFSDQVSGRASYSFQDDRVRGRRLSNSPRHQGYAALLFPVVAGVQGGAELVVVGPRLTLLRHEVSTVTLVNLNLVMPTPIAGLEIATGLYNLLNQKYSDPGAAEHVQDRIEQDRFSYRAEISYRW